MENEVRKVFEEAVNIPIVEIKKLNGLSNHVFSITTTVDKRYIFKILNERFDPFKSLERKLMKYVCSLYESPLYDVPKYRISKMLSCKDMTLPEIMTPTNRRLIMRQVANFNNIKKMKTERPNFFYILDNYNSEMMQRIKENLDTAEPNLKAELEYQMVVVNKLCAQLKKKVKFEEMVFSHNDLFHRNILFDLENKCFHLIDYEYIGYNPFGMDVFQFINEWLIDYSFPSKPYFKLKFENYPSSNEIRDLIRFYLYFYQNTEKSKNRRDDIDLISEVKNSEEFKNIKESEIDKIHNLFPYFGMITNIYWFYWGIYMCSMEGINFDYFEFSKTKYEMIKIFANQFGDDEIVSLLA